MKDVSRNGIGPDASFSAKHPHGFLVKRGNKKKQFRVAKGE